MIKHVFAIATVGTLAMSSGASAQVQEGGLTGAEGGLIALLGIGIVAGLGGGGGGTTTTTTSPSN
ncbi:MAG: hypothetical protein AAF408_00245 [Pseudomonadota bacterium]